ncbi:glycosyltransferase involved in cell wall biosynthesis [Kineococcus xinjiangensis]|uniref:Glycosyltransferase involved in cell wall biosynthesis n=1 Tax=Kineococcus xinjiangensis TaxID=512762 RepID=A0A2S6ITZ6_9ACTN|nr:glycosyltransferase family 4 protein [Kineococcus xinjiangensis]PPK97641.1 glycosyltransferase involved in cell wall biosynthesis [Kineococcus xinjiangensis]
MRVLHVSDCYLPRLGGIETHVHDLTAVQRAAGLDVRVLTATPAAQPGTEDGTEVGVVRLAPRDLLDPRRPGALLRSALEAAEADVVHVHSSVVSPLAWAAARQARGLGLPVVATLHSMVRDGAATTGMRRALGPAVVEGIRWTAVSRVAARPLQEALGQPVSVLHNGIQPALWRPGPHPRPPGAGREVVTLVSALRFARRKRPHALLRLLAAVRRDVGPHVELRAVLMGDGPMWAAARRRVRALGMAGWVEMPGRCTREEVRHVLARGDVYLAPARLESFGLAALEARCAGLAVVAFAGSGVEEFVRPGVEGFLARDDDDMAAVVSRIAAQPEVLAAVRAHNLGTEPAMTWPQVLRAGLAQYTAAGAPPVVPWPRRVIDLPAGPVHQPGVLAGRSAGGR